MIRVAITQGDTNGVGYELILKAFSEPEMLELCTPIIYGSPKIAAYHSKALQSQCQFSIIKHASEARDGRVNLLACFDEEVKVEFGQSTEESNAAALKALDRAIADSREGLFDVLVCGPMKNGGIKVENLQFADQTEFVEASLRNGKKVMPLYINDIIRMVLATKGSMKDVAAHISQEGIAQLGTTLHSTLKRDFMLSNPRIAVLALNPNDGVEEQNIIMPAVKELKEAGIQAFGPYQAESFFAGRGYEAFDGIIAMYHDQGILPVKMLTDCQSVVVMANMDIVCTMPDADAQMQIAGKNEADESTLRNAIYAGIDIFRRRKEYDEPFANPLQKLYHERPDSGEKLRFSIPKKKEE